MTTIGLQLEALLNRTCFTVNPSVARMTLTGETINLIFTSPSVLAWI